MRREREASSENSTNANAAYEQPRFTPSRK